MTVHSQDGLELATLSWEGVRPQILMVHATGFVKEMWSPVVEELRTLGNSAHITALDQRGHGDSESTHPPFDWWDLGRDALVAARTSGARFGVGHSSGAAALAMAELLEPGTFDHLVLIEPIAFPGPYAHLPEMSMAVAARKRRDVFADADHAERNFREKPIFSRWDERAMRMYIDHAFTSDERGHVLKCSGATEAEFYSAGSAHGLWDRLHELTIPVTLVAGSDSDTHQGAFLAAQQQRFRTVEVEVVANAGHLVPMEAPARVAELVHGAFQETYGR
ncbi:MAG: alpha/beta hydrolase [Acidimicrobiia bacterium]|nr:alpha/beta hydrolase [Acidimicrobiia bacterium]